MSLPVDQADVAKTGQSLIASEAFQGLADAPKSTEGGMEVDTVEEKGEAPKKAYTAPIDPITNDLVIEGTIYLRLLLILLNLDAGRTQLVCCANRQ